MDKLLVVQHLRAPNVYEIVTIQLGDKLITIEHIADSDSLFLKIKQGANVDQRTII
jgi:hypothetical protein